MSASLEQLTADFTRLIGPEAFLPKAPPPAPTPAPVVAPVAPPIAGAAPAAVAKPATLVAPPPPASPVQTVDPLLKGYNFDATVAPTQVVEAAQILDRAGFAIDAVTGVDWIAQGEMEVVYDFFHPTAPLRAVVRTRVPRGEPELPTISTVFPGANWHERETHDFFGIRFLGHPNLKPFLLPEDADFHPLRKDYKP
jgi:NADH-quinone oxidoreductase subunit C